LTQQKYNDAAVKQFFRAAVEADKPIIVLFNLCDLEADRDYWPQWLARFCAETGADPELVYVVPYDRAAAQELRLPFYRLEKGGVKRRELRVESRETKDESSAIGAEGAQGQGPTAAQQEQTAPQLSTLNSQPSTLNSPPSATDLRDELAALHFDAIKLRTFRGALARVLDPVCGLPAYLAEVRAAAEQFAAAAVALSATEMARVAWPNLPSGVLVEEMRQWWDAGRNDWSRRVHGFYRYVGRGVMKPLRAAWSAVAGPAEDPLAAFRRQEKTAMIAAVERLLDELQRLSQVGNAILQPRLERVLGGRARAELLDKIESAHRDLPPVDDEFRTVLRTELDALKAAYPRTTRWFQTLDQAVAVARPAITVTLFISGGVVAGDLLGQAAMHAAGHIAADAAIATGIAEAVVPAAGEGLRQAAARLFRRLQACFAQRRAQWLAGLLEEQLLGDLLAELRQGAAVVERSAYREVEAGMAELKM
jgi:hypothetical protein